MDAFVCFFFVSGRMSLLITCMLTLANTSNSLLFSLPTSTTFTALDLWMTACKCFVLLALLEYAFLLKVRGHLLQHKQANAARRNRKRNNKRQGADGLKLQSEEKEEKKTLFWRVFPSDPDQFCRYVDLRAEVAAQLGFHVFVLVYCVVYYNRSLFLANFRGNFS